MDTYLHAFLIVLVIDVLKLISNAWSHFIRNVRVEGMNEFVILFYIN